jgi:hypothetical protein
VFTVGLAWAYAGVKLSKVDFHFIPGTANLPFWKRIQITYGPHHHSTHLHHAKDDKDLERQTEEGNLLPKGLMLGESLNRSNPSSPTSPTGSSFNLDKLTSNTSAASSSSSSHAFSTGSSRKDGTQPLSFFQSWLLVVAGCFSHFLLDTLFEDHDPLYLWILSTGYNGPNANAITPPVAAAFIMAISGIIIIMVLTQSSLAQGVVPRGMTPTLASHIAVLGLMVVYLVFVGIRLTIKPRIPAGKLVICVELLTETVTNKYIPKRFFCWGLTSWRGSRFWSADLYVYIPHLSLITLSLQL